MKLKHYQEKVINTLKDYLSALNDFKAKYEKALEIDPDVARDYDFPKRAFAQATNRNTYYSKTNGLNQPLPDIYLKVPTGGGKTLLACHSIDLIQKSYLKKQTGLVLWIVPSTQIYRQTIKALKDREHPYRQTLDISSGGRTLIKEKTEMFNRLDVEENLVVLMLMLPSANRQNKETLKVFRDAGGFTEFFPAEDNYPAQNELLKHIPNLDCFGEEGEVFRRQIKTSLGNTLKVIKPLVIIDEGHRAYGELARNTVKNFNPSFILELSATPPPNTNELVKITGRELHEEEMIKLDIHLTNKASLDWKNTLLASFEKRNDLEKKAIEYEQNTGEYIRPICLIQVERTGKDQRGTDFIHAEDAKEYLMKKCNIPEKHIAIKSSEKDDIEGINLFAKDCEIRYIITKQALQEGWDCSFAYILCILTNPQSATGITQLVGRILRQPNARKTKVKELDECYLYTYKPNAATLVREIKNGLESEGLGDIAGRLVNDEGGGGENNLKDKETNYRPGFKKFDGKIYLPKFVIQEKESWRDIIFEADILNGIDWSKIDIKEIGEKTLSDKQTKEQELTLGLSKEEKQLLQETGRLETKGTLEIDEAFLARQLSDVVPNPWVAFEMGKEALQILSKKYDKETIAANFVFIIEELKKILDKEKNRLAEDVFRKLLDKKKLCFFLIQEKGHHLLPSHIKVKSNRQLVRSDNSPIQKSLFDYVPDEDLNETEKTVAIYLDEQEQLLWWYRNRVRKDFHIQGWQRNKIYPDFIAAKSSKTKKDDYETVYVLETKGVHLKENDDTRYKKNVFALCNELGAKKAWKELFDEFPDHNFEFQVVFEDEWQNEINKKMN
ncbi:MAG: DEAD/DEAH box helicase family protein [Saprospiraceae bacterium]|nr:DEAD/DEAH box helicase family protein [Saprospiraceae bacterium]HMW38039.1 DEAD/DEAH box helicase family protein [Saprospiraceae bacterium]HMX87001.1 DEAD/DEAH box helicase family protein [Saprospiraceae bacterium]HNB30180.1 DEAD/DEAH box helicase family protein [Saprospiraceae bacterium]HNC35838.1 DEAD/DEAH box helicase family protein [Saprospiraceae bacterium]